MYIQWRDAMYLPEHCPACPVPVNPEIQKHEKLPFELVQTALTSQVCDPAAHSSTSETRMRKFDTISMYHET